MKNLIFVDCEAVGPCPSMGRLTEFGAVDYSQLVFLPESPFCPKGQASWGQHDSIFYGIIKPGKHEGVCAPEEAEVFTRFDLWLQEHTTGRPIMVSDNPAFDFQWINDGFWRTLGRNPFGHSARRISDFYAGLRGDFAKTQDWKKLRVTPHDHNPVHDALGNCEAFYRMLHEILS